MRHQAGRSLRTPGSVERTSSTKNSSRHETILHTRKKNFLQEKKEPRYCLNVCALLAVPHSSPHKYTRNKRHLFSRLFLAENSSFCSLLWPGRFVPE